MIPRLSIYVTTECARGCPLCSQRPLMDALPNYQMSVEELVHLITRVKELGIEYREAWLTGGEPTLWHYLRAGVIQLRRHFERVGMNTNGRAPADCLLFDEVQVTAYPGVEKKFKGHENVKFADCRHLKFPNKPVEGALPADCRCNFHSYIAGRLYTCGNVFSRLRHLGRDPFDPVFSCSVDGNFGEHWERTKDRKKWRDVCKRCLGNRKVWDIVEKRDTIDEAMDS